MDVVEKRYESYLNKVNIGRSIGNVIERESKPRKIGYISRMMSSFPDEAETTILNALDNCWITVTLKVAAHEEEYDDKRPYANQQPLVMSGLTTTGGWRGGR